MTVTTTITTAGAKTRFVGNVIVTTITLTVTGTPETVTVRDAVLSGVSRSWSAVGSAGVTGLGASGLGEINQTLTIPVGGTVTYTINDTPVTAPVSGSRAYVNTVTVGGTAFTGKTVDVWGTRLPGTPAWTQTVTATPAALLSGQTTTWTARVTNTGTGTGPVTFQLPCTQGPVSVSVNGAAASVVASPLNWTGTIPNTGVVNGTPTTGPGRTYTGSFTLSKGYAVTAIKVGAVSDPSNVTWGVQDDTAATFMTNLKVALEARVPGGVATITATPAAGGACTTAPWTFNVTFTQCADAAYAPATLGVVTDSGRDLILNPGFDGPLAPGPGVNEYRTRQDVGGDILCTNTANVGWYTNDPAGEFEMWGPGFLGITPTPRGTAIQEINANARNTLWQTFDAGTGGTFFVEAVVGGRGQTQQIGVRLSTGDTNDTGPGDVLNQTVNAADVVGTGAAWTTYAQSVTLGPGLYTFSIQGPNTGSSGGIFTDLRVYTKNPGTITEFTPSAAGSCTVNQPTALENGGEVVFTWTETETGAFTRTCTSTLTGPGTVTTPTVTATAVWNGPPVYTPAASNTAQTVPVGGTVAAVAATDPEGDAITYTRQSGTLPPGVTGITAAGGFSGSPTTKGTYTVVVRATSTGGFTDTTLVITVPDRGPVYTPATSNTAQTVPVGGPITAVAATDPDGDPVSYTVTNGVLPAGVTFNANGTFTGSPATKGTYTVTIRAVSNGGTADTTLTITVPDRGPVYTSAASNTAQTVPVGTPVSSVSATDPDGDPVSYALQSGTLPPGVTGITPAGGFTGTPTSAGTFTVVIRATSNGGTADTTLVITVPNRPPTYTAAPSNTTQSLLVGGTATALAATDPDGDAITHSIVSGTMPPGITLNPDGTFSGTATTAGTFTVRFRATSTGGTADTTVVFTSVNQPPSYTSAATNTAQTVPVGSTVTALAASDPEGDPITHTVVSGTLPPGVTLNPNGTFTGAVTGSGTFTVTVRASATGGTATTVLVITVPNQPPTYTAVASNTAQSLIVGGTPSSLAAVDPEGDPITHALTGGALPPGMSLNPNGTFTGTPTTPGVYTATFRATATGGSATTTVTFTINGAPAYTGATSNISQTVPIGSPVVALAATDPEGDAITYTLTGGALPPGVTLNANGTFTGSPTAPGTYTVNVRASATGGSAVTTLTINVPVPNGPPVWTAAPTNTGQGLTVGGPAPVAMQAVDPESDPITYTVQSGTVPPGVTLNPNGTWTGTPTTPGTFTVVIRAAANGGSADTTVVFTIPVPNGPPVYTAAPTNTAQAMVVGGGATALAATDPEGDAITHTVVAGTLPPGVSLNADGTFVGTATKPGTYVVTFRATATGGTANTTVTFTIPVPNGPPLYTGAPTNTAQTVPTGTVPTRLFAVDPEADPITHTLTGGTLPPGVTLNPDGTFSGTPTTPGIYTATFQAKAVGGTASTTVVFTIKQKSSLTPNPLPYCPPGTTTGTGASGSSGSLVCADGKPAFRVVDTTSGTPVVSFMGADGNTIIPTTWVPGGCENQPLPTVQFEEVCATNDGGATSIVAFKKWYTTPAGQTTVSLVDENGLLLPAGYTVTKCVTPAPDSKDFELVCASNDAGVTVVQAWRQFTTDAAGTIQTVLVNNTGAPLPTGWVQVPCVTQTSTVEFVPICVENAGVKTTAYRRFVTDRAGVSSSMVTDGAGIPLPAVWVQVPCENSVTQYDFEPVCYQIAGTGPVLSGWERFATDSAGLITTTLLNASGATLTGATPAPCPTGNRVDVEACCYQVAGTGPVLTGWKHFTFDNTGVLTGTVITDLDNTTVATAVNVACVTAPSTQTSFQPVCYQVAAGPALQGWEQFTTAADGTVTTRVLNTATVPVTGAVIVPCPTLTASADYEAVCVNDGTTVTQGWREIVRATDGTIASRLLTTTLTTYPAAAIQVPCPDPTFRAVTLDVGCVAGVQWFIRTRHDQTGTTFNSTPEYSLNGTTWQTTAPTGFTAGPCGPSRSLSEFSVGTVCVTNGATSTNWFVRHTIVRDLTTGTTINEGSWWSQDGDVWQNTAPTGTVRPGTCTAPTPDTTGTWATTPVCVTSAGISAGWLQRSRYTITPTGTVTTVTEWSPDTLNWSTTIPTGTVTPGACQPAAGVDLDLTETVWCVTNAPAVRRVVRNETTGAVTITWNRADGTIFTPTAADTAAATPGACLSCASQILATGCWKNAAGTTGTWASVRDGLSGAIAVIDPVTGATIPAADIVSCSATSLYTTTVDTVTGATKTISALGLYSWSVRLRSGTGTIQIGSVTTAMDVGETISSEASPGSSLTESVIVTTPAGSSARIVYVVKI